MTKKKSVGRDFFFVIAYSFRNLYRNSKVDITGSWQNKFFINDLHYFEVPNKGGGCGFNKKRWLDNYEKLIKGVVLKKEGGQVLIKGCPVHINY